MTSVRGPLWRVGAPARSILLGAIALYRLTLSGWLGGQCRFSPSCSRYAEEAIRTHGALKGTFLTVGRVLRCNPFGRGGRDPVPRSHSYEAAHESAPTPGRARDLSYDGVAYDSDIRRLAAQGERDAG